jgi:hypothetical protein
MRIRARAHTHTHTHTHTCNRGIERAGEKGEGCGDVDTKIQGFNKVCCPQEMARAEKLQDQVQVLQAKIAHHRPPSASALPSPHPSSPIFAFPLPPGWKLPSLTRQDITTPPAPKMAPLVSSRPTPPSLSNAREELASGSEREAGEVPGEIAMAGCVVAGACC